MDTKNASCVKVLHAGTDARMAIFESQNVVNVSWTYATNARLEKKVIFRGFHVQTVVIYYVGTASIWLCSTGRLKIIAMEREDILYPFMNFNLFLKKMIVL